jgi:hypothetical protein
MKNIIPEVFILLSSFSLLITGVFSKTLYKIINFDLYYFLPVNEKIYSRICICKLDKDVFMKLNSFGKIIKTLTCFG